MTGDELYRVRKDLGDAIGRASAFRRWWPTMAHRA